MCSTICENAIDSFRGSECHGEADNEKEDVSEDLVISALTVLEPPSTAFADLDSSVAHLEQNIRLRGSSLGTCVRDQLQRSTTKNFEGREYITKHTLLQAVSQKVVHSLFQEYITGFTRSAMAKQTLTESRLEIVRHIEMEARALLALCVFINASMRTFLELLQAGLSDKSLPLAGECPIGIDQIDFGHILEYQWTFVPYDIFAQTSQIAIPKDMIVPLKCDKKKYLLGSGAYSDVFRVQEDHSQYCSISKQRKPSIYALKRFKDNPYVEKSFAREYAVLQELTRIPHDHILLHLTAWSQRDVFYILFPQARSNLRTFMDEVECPGLDPENIIWFFKQLYGLADAVRHLHALEPLPALFQFRADCAAVETDQAAFHNDIKPENILVFDSENGSPGVLKISDFGCGKVVTKDRNCATQATEGFYGTPEYESPDFATHKEASKPNDIWALGCVFLELLDWFTIPKTEKQMTFQSQRYTGPGPTSPAFWYRNAENRVQLKPQVGLKLVDLENSSCYGKRGFENVLEIIWRLLDVDMKDRSTAEHLYNDVNHVVRQAIYDVSKDPDYYLRPGTRDGTNHLPLAALPTPSWFQDSRTGGMHRAYENWLEHRQHEKIKGYDWDAINAQVCDFPGHEPYPMG